MKDSSEAQIVEIALTFKHMVKKLFTMGVKSDNHTGFKISELLAFEFTSYWWMFLKSKLHLFQ